MRIIFMGTPDFSVTALDALVTAGHDIICVYSQPPRRAGRGKVARKSPVHIRAEELGLLVRTPPNFKDVLEVDQFGDLGADIAVVVAYGLLLPQSVLDAPQRGCLNIHASLLPRWRGAAPMQRAIMAGDPKTGVCIMQMEAGLDTGPVLMRAQTPIDSNDTYKILHDRLAGMGADAITRTLDQINQLKPLPQDETGATYARKIDKAEALIDWNKPAEVVDRQIRGLSPFPGAWSMIGSERIKFLMSKVVAGAGPPGQTIDDQLTIGTSDGAVRIERLQRAGKAAAASLDLLRGYPIPKGTFFT